MASRTAVADIARRRQAIYLGLSANLDEAQAKAALRVWDTGYAQTRPTAIIDFVADIALQLELPPKQRHEVRMGLYQALLRFDAGREMPPEIPSGPLTAVGPAAGGVAAPVLPEGPGATPAYVVFSVVAEGLLEGVKNDGPVALHDFSHSLESQSTVTGPRGEDRPALLAWIQGSGGLSGFAKASEAQLARVVHSLYVASAEALGPVAADRLLAHSVSQAEGLREARRFSPRKLL